jgi:hypothetical protein
MAHFYSKINWDVRYPPNWEALKKEAHLTTGRKCCVCLEASSKEVHHSRYLGNSDLPGVNLFPVCLPCHKVCHSKANWFKHKGNPLWKSANTPQWEAKLKHGFNQLSQSQKNKDK